MIDFLVAGAQKAGTRALRHFLSQHPDIGLSRPSKPEPHFFDWVLGPPNPAALPGAYQKYHDMFTSKELALVTGDVTPNYLYDVNALARAHAYKPAMKIIVLLRNPIDRAYSQWVMQVRKEIETRTFLPALLHEFRVFQSTGQHRNFSYVQRGFYDGQIARLQSLFPSEQCLILRTEDLSEHHAETLGNVFRFLRVSPTIAPKKKRVHARRYPPMPPYSRRLLRSIFAPDIKRLEHRLGWDCSAWLA
jgi:Sulfotransferase domain